MADDLAIDVHDLRKRFGARTVVDGVSLQVRRGEIHGFLGPNGSGKTTCIRMMCGLLTPDGGHGTCLGHDIVRESALIKREVGYMTQKFSFWDDLTIRENLEFVARLYGMQERRRAVDEALAHLGLANRQQQLAGALSGGWKQRLALAACLLHEPQLLLLDEPTAGVDPTARRDFWDELHQLAAGGISVLVSTHYMDEAERCHRLAYIAYGRLLATGSAAELVKGRQLTTFEVRAEAARHDALAALSRRLAGAPGVEQTVAFGEALHASGRDGAALERSLRAALAGQPGLVLAPAATGLEDVFIHLMRGAEDNYAETRADPLPQAGEGAMRARASRKTPSPPPGGAGRRERE